MLKKLSITLLVLCSFCLVGCNYTDGDSFVRSNDFDKYEEYKEFYDVFCEYNQERFIMPENNDSIEITYFFNGVADIEYVNTDWQYIDYRFVYMSFKVINLADQFENEKLANYAFEFKAYNIADKYDDVYSNISEICYKVNTESKSVSIFIGDIEVAGTGYGADTFIKDENFTEVMDKIISAFKDINA